MITTTNYQLFKFKEDNRKINESFVLRLMESIKEVGYITSKPIMVNTNMEIIDGQHRFEACKNLGLPIIYAVEEQNNEHRTLILLNSNQQAWKLTDYIHSWAKSGVTCYQRFESFENKYLLGSSNNILILFEGYADSNSAAKIRQGYIFKINPKSHDIAKFIIEAGEHIPFNKSSKFVGAITKLFNLATDEQLDKVRKKIPSLQQQVNTIDYIAVFENIVNKGKKPGNKISWVKTI